MTGSTGAAVSRDLGQEVSFSDEEVSCGFLVSSFLPTSSDDGVVLVDILRLFEVTADC